MFKIFVIEDDEKISDIIVENLLKSGYDCIAAKQLSDIMPEFLEYKPDLVLLDIILPFFDGYSRSRNADYVKCFNCCCILYNYLLFLLRFICKKLHENCMGKEKINFGFCLRTINSGKSHMWLLYRGKILCLKYL